MAEDTSPNNPGLQVEKPPVTRSLGGVFNGEIAPATDAAPQPEPKAEPKTEPKLEAKAEPKPKVPEGMIPASRLAEERAKFTRKLEAAGLDPETGKPVKAAAPEEPWRADLKPEPDKAGKIVDGKLEAWDDTAEYLREVARVQAHNTWVENSGRAKVEAESNRKQADADKFIEEEAKSFREWDTVKRPAFIAEVGITEEQFEASRTALAEMPDVPDANAQLFRYFTLHEAESGPQFLYELGKLPPARLAEMAAMPTAALHREFLKLDARLSAGLNADGSLRAQGVLTKSGANGKDGVSRPPSDSGESRRVSAAPPPPSQVGGGSGTIKKSLDEMDTKERIAHWAEEDRARRMKKYGGKVVQ